MERIDPKMLHDDGIHPALRYSFKELVSMLDCGAKDKAIKVKTHRDGLEMFTYSRATIYDRDWSPATIIARGIVIDRQNQKIVSVPLPKFFNWGEATSDEPSNKYPIEVYEKVDGSLAIAYYHNDQWNVTTKGSFNSSQFNISEKWLRGNKQLTNSMYPGNTYLFEWISKRDRIVIDYGEFEGLVLLSAYNNETGREFSRKQIESLSAISGVRCAKSYQFDSIDQIIEKANALPATHEGWVVRYPCGYRIKVKGDAYCEIHKSISNFSPISVWEHFVSTNSPSKLKTHLPEEFAKEVDIVYDILRSRFDEKLDVVKSWIKESSGWSDKEIAFSDSIPDGIKQYLFMDRSRVRNGNGEGVYIVTVPGTKERKKFCELFRPNNNVLDGYETLSVINRF